MFTVIQQTDYLGHSDDFFLATSTTSFDFCCTSICVPLKFSSEAALPVNLYIFISLMSALPVV